MNIRPGRRHLEVLVPVAATITGGALGAATAHTFDTLNISRRPATAVALLLLAIIAGQVTARRARAGRDHRRRRAPIPAAPTTRR